MKQLLSSASVEEAQTWGSCNYREWLRIVSYCHRAALCCPPEMEGTSLLALGRVGEQPCKHSCAPALPTAGRAQLNTCWCCKAAQSSALPKPRSIHVAPSKHWAKCTPNSPPLQTPAQLPLRLHTAVAHTRPFWQAAPQLLLSTVLIVVPSAPFAIHHSLCWHRAAAAVLHLQTTLGSANLHLTTPFPSNSSLSSQIQAQMVLLVEKIQQVISILS